MCSDKNTKVKRKKTMGHNSRNKYRNRNRNKNNYLNGSRIILGTLTGNEMVLRSWCLIFKNRLKSVFFQHNFENDYENTRIN